MIAARSRAAPRVGPRGGRRMRMGSVDLCPCGRGRRRHGTPGDNVMAAFIDNLQGLRDEAAPCSLIDKQKDY